MALQFNEYLKGVNGLTGNMFYSGNWGWNTNDNFLYFYPSTVAFPATAPAASNITPAGFILTFTLSATSSIAIRNGAISLGTTLTANTTAAGTISWAYYRGFYNAGYAGFITDSVGITGSSKLLTISTLTPTSGQAVILSNMNIKFI